MHINIYTYTYASLIIIRVACNEWRVGRRDIFTGSMYGGLFTFVYIIILCIKSK